MKTTAKIALCFVTSALALAQSVTAAANPQVVVDVFKEVSANVKAADIEKLAARFDSSVELLLPGVEKTCTARQAAVLLQEFFVRYKPTDFAALHVGGKSDKHYGIGLLTTPGGRFRTTIFLQLKGSSYIIQQLRIEHDL